MHELNGRARVLHLILSMFGRSNTGDFGVISLVSLVSMTARRGTREREFSLSITCMKLELASVFSFCEPSRRKDAILTYNC